LLSFENKFTERIS